MTVATRSSGSGAANSELKKPGFESDVGDLVVLPANMFIGLSFAGLSTSLVRCQLRLVVSLTSAKSPSFFFTIRSRSAWPGRRLGSFGIDIFGIVQFAGFSFDAI